MCAIGLRDFIPDRPSTVVVSGFSTIPFRLHKHMTVESAIDASEYYCAVQKTLRTNAGYKVLKTVADDILRLK